MLMVGVSTAQNITNLVPAVTTGVELEKLLLLETTTAKRNNWSGGIEDVLNQRGIKVDRLDLTGIDSNIVEITNAVLEAVKEHNDPIVWNIGGGQKPQQISLWEIFRLRNEQGIRDSVCYANQDNRQQSVLEIWEFDRHNQLFKREQVIEVDLTAEQIFRVFNFSVKRSTQIYPIDQRSASQDILDLMQYHEFRDYLFELARFPRDPGTWGEDLNLEIIAERLKDNSAAIEAEISNLFKRASEKDISNPNKVTALSSRIRAYLVGNKDQKTGAIVEWLKSKRVPGIVNVKNAELRVQLNLSDAENGIEIGPALLQNIAPGVSKPSNYFESIVVSRICEMLNTLNHNVTCAYANLEIARIDNESNVTAEYDVLLVTNRGTIIALDAKTFDFENKDIDARLYNLEQGSGYYRTFSPVIPLDFEDVDTSKPPKELINLLFRLHKKRIGFYVVSDSTKDKSFWLRRSEQENMIEKSLSKPDQEGWVECMPLSMSIA